MVLAAKVFLVREPVELESLAMKLRGYQVKERVEEGGQEFELLTEAQDLRLSKESLHGVFGHDELLPVFHRGRVQYVPRTIEAPIAFHAFEQRVLLTVLEKKQRANQIANALSKLLFITTGRIVEARIDPEVFRRFHEENYATTKIIFFDQLDLPNIEKLSLYGEELANTSLYTDYLGHGKIWYVVIRAKKQGFVVGVTRNCVVTCFSRIEEPDFLAYIAGDIFPLIS